MIQKSVEWKYYSIMEISQFVIVIIKLQIQFLYNIHKIVDVTYAMYIDIGEIQIEPFAVVLNLNAGVETGRN